jgi:hypothetical protein
MAEAADRTVSRAVLSAAAPQLFVADVTASCDFFTAKLGFSTVLLYGELPFYGHVRRDGALLILCCVVPSRAKNFIVKDPDGNLLLFAGPAA